MVSLYMYANVHIVGGATVDVPKDELAALYCVAVSRSGVSLTHDDSLLRHNKTNYIFKTAKRPSTQRSDPWGHSNPWGHSDPFGHSNRLTDPFGHSNWLTDPFGHSNGLTDPFGHSDPFDDDVLQQLFSSQMRGGGNKVATVSLGKTSDPLAVDGTSLQKGLTAWIEKNLKYKKVQLNGKSYVVNGCSLATKYIHPFGYQVVDPLKVDMYSKGGYDKPVDAYLKDKGLRQTAGSVLMALVVVEFALHLVPPNAVAHRRAPFGDGRDHGRGRRTKVPPGIDADARGQCNHDRLVGDHRQGRLAGRHLQHLSVGDNRRLQKDQTRHH